MITTQERKQALATYLEIDVNDITLNPYDKNSFNTPDDETYLVLTEEEADTQAMQRIEQAYDEQGVQGYGEDYQKYIIDNFIDSEEFDDILFQHELFYVNDLESDTHSNEFDNCLYEQLMENDYLTLRDFDYDDESGIYSIKSDAKTIDKVFRATSDYVQQLVDDAGDSIAWYKFEFGESAFSDYVKNHPDVIDTKALFDDILQTDGRGLQLADYDGDELELSNNLFAYRTN